jgi:hypothetical protein
MTRRRGDPCALLPRYLRTQLFGACWKPGQRTGRLDDRDGQRHAQRRRLINVTIRNRSRQAAITTELLKSSLAPAL